jgi:hypothetical protein
VIVGNTSSFGSATSSIYVIKVDKSGNLLWSKIFDNRAAYVSATEDGGCIITGNGDRMLLLKLDADGNTEWVQFYRYFTFNTSSSVIQTSDGGYLFGDISYSYESDDYYSIGILIKTDTRGNVQWTKNFNGDEFFQYSYLFRATGTQDGGFALAFYNLDEVAFGDYNIYLYKFSAAGNFEWGKSFDMPENEQLGDLKVTPDEGYLIAASADFGDGWKLWAIKTNNKGNIQWSKAVGTGGSKSQFGNSIVLTSDKGYLISGTRDSSYGKKSTDIITYPYITKLDSSGNLLWTRVVKVGLGINASNGAHLVNASDSGYVLACTANRAMNGEDFSLIKFSPSGKTCNDFERESTISDYGNAVTGENISEVTGITSGVGKIKTTVVNTILNSTCGDVLPVTLLSFSAVKDKASHNKLSWVTAQEINSNYFTIERSIKGTVYDVIGTVKAAGNSNINSQYNFYDYKPFAGINYYRLEIVDKDGRFVYSEVKSINNASANNAAAEVSAYPNPVKDKLMLMINLNKASLAYAEIVTMDGIVIQKVTVPLTAGANVFPLYLSMLRQGFYILKIQTDEEEKKIKFEKN